MSELPALGKLRENFQNIDDAMSQLEQVFAGFLSSPEGQGILSNNQTSAIFEQSDFTDKYHLSLKKPSHKEEILAVLSLGGSVKLMSHTADGGIEREYSLVGLQPDQAAAQLLGFLMDADEDSRMLQSFSRFIRKEIGYQTKAYDPATVREVRLPPMPT